MDENITAEKRVRGWGGAWGGGVRKYACLTASMLLHVHVLSGACHAGACIFRLSVLFSCIVEHIFLLQRLCD